MTLILTLQLSPEEEERRRLRRERNKLAAAKCRQRRVDQTNTLINVSIDNFYQVALVTITGTTISVPYLLSQVTATHMKIGYPIFKWVAVTWQEWEGTGIVVPAITTRRHT